MSVDRPQFLPGQVSRAYTWAGQHRELECYLRAEPTAAVDWFVRGVKLENNNTSVSYTHLTLPTKRIV